jgi:peptidoglycan/LPS O-acetylase OafA/YrhL
LRKRELDFLRGLAILLVLCRHQYFVSLTYRIGWIGVDLFFVLSGFLVSGLLFKEYQKYGEIQAGRFLIRRGFKIYPLYYLFYLPYFWVEPLSLGVHWQVVVADLLFLQNYLHGWGYAYAPSWSLAVEEHFYFMLVLVFWILMRKQKFSSALQILPKTPLTQLEFGIISVMAFCLMFRILSNHFFWEQIVRNYTMTHLRMDSLLMGVLISAAYHFRREKLEKFYEKDKKRLFWVFFFGLVWTPIWDVKYTFLAKTIGFTCVYLGFGVMLLAFLLEKNINEYLDKYLSKWLINLVSRMGVYSYAIYIIHSFVNSVFEQISKQQGWSDQIVLLFVLTSVVSCSLGWAMYEWMEKPFLWLRDRWFPSRTSVIGL